jgi:hypothetical protein
MMPRIVKMSLVLTFVLCCVAPLARAAGTSRPENAPGPSFLQSQPLVTPNLSAKAQQGTSPFAQPQPQPKWMDEYADCEASCFDGWNQCCTYGGCEQCSCQLALCRAGCGDPYYGC